MSAARTCGVDATDDTEAAEAAEATERLAVDKSAA